MASTIARLNVVTVSMPLAEFLQAAGVPDPENWENPAGGTDVVVTVEQRTPGSA